MYSGAVLAAMIVACAQAQPQGTIVYTGAPEGGPPWPVQDVYSIRADGSGAKALTRDGHSHHPSWSPDGKRILFIHDAELSTKPAYRETGESKSHHPVELSIMDADGRNRRVLRRIEPVIYSAVWSPDGSTLAISAATEPGAGEPATAGIFFLPASGSGELRLYMRNGWTPSWSPDGKKLAFTVEHPRGRWTVHTANADGTNDVRLTSPHIDSGSPAWSPDGKLIAFEQFTGVAGRQQVFLMNADGSAIRQLTTDTAWSCTHPTWSPDGGRLVVACRFAASPCGMGVFSTGQPMPECTRRLFVLPVASSQASKPAMLVSQDAAFPSFRAMPN
jgi:Tol biopolymer transport system component